MKILVNKDVYNICSRIKHYDASYRVVFDTELSVYQIYSTKIFDTSEIISGKRLSYVLTIPIDELDTRALQYLYDTEVHDINILLDRLDAENDMTEKLCEEQTIHNSLKVAESQLRKLTK